MGRTLFSLVSMFQNQLEETFRNMIGVEREAKKLMFTASCLGQDCSNNQKNVCFTIL